MKANVSISPVAKSMPGRERAIERGGNGIVGLLGVLWLLGLWLTHLAAPLSRCWRRNRAPYPSSGIIGVITRVSAIFVVIIRL